MKTIDSRSQSVDGRLLAAIHKLGRGAVFVPADFLELGTRSAIDVVLHRLVRKGVIRRLARGVYDFPRTHPKLGTLHPSADVIAKALAARDGSRLQPAGAHAANLLGLSTQVPARVVYLTDGVGRIVRVGATTIELRRTTAKNMATAGRLSGLLVQALRNLGKEHVNSERVAFLKRRLPLEQRKELVRDLRFAPTWMHAIFRELAEEPA